MTHSIRRRFINWLERVCNHTAKQIVELLSRPDVEPQTGGNINHARIIGVDKRGRECQIENPVVVPSFADDINVSNGRSAVPNFPPLGTHRNLAPLNNASFIAAHNQLLVIHQMERDALVRAFSKESSEDKS